MRTSAAAHFAPPPAMEVAEDVMEASFARGLASAECFEVGAHALQTHAIPSADFMSQTCSHACLAMHSNSTPTHRRRQWSLPQCSPMAQKIERLP